ncbi:unnamed protein product [Schistocephalus solidus]|uniref:RNase III domain-containing protein n=1 Tax=Schistocephalus solidus TaxID=70667 RepID=A0A183SS05_SCHSO|nr:unnamed protein product [Schistocephalus solidus]
MLRFLSPTARKLALTSGFSLTKPFPITRDILTSLFDNQLTTGAADEKFYKLHLTPGQSADDFAMAVLASLHLLPTDLDALILRHFVTSVRDRTITRSFLLQPLPNLVVALKQCHQYHEFYAEATPQNLVSNHHKSPRAI